MVSAFLQEYLHERLERVFVVPGVEDHLDVRVHLLHDGVEAGVEVDRLDDQVFAVTLPLLRLALESVDGPGQANRTKREFRVAFIKS